MTFSSAFVLFTSLDESEHFSLPIPSDIQPITRPYSGCISCGPLAERFCILPSFLILVSYRQDMDLSPKVNRTHTPARFERSSSPSIKQSALVLPQSPVPTKIVKISTVRIHRVAKNENVNALLEMYSPGTCPLVLNDSSILLGVRREKTKGTSRGLRGCLASDQRTCGKCSRYL